MKGIKKRKLTSFGLKVKNRLADLNMSQKELAEKLNTSEVYLSMILYGERTGRKYLDDIIIILDLKSDNKELNRFYPNIDNN